MTSANRVQVLFVRETTPGTTPVTPRMRTARITSETLAFNPTYVDSDEVRSDRMIVDPILVMKDSNGGVSFELSYPEDGSFLSDVLRSGLMAPWVNTPTFDNDGTADSIVTDAGTVTDTYAVASGGAAAVLGHLVRATGFTNTANNQVFRVASSSATTVVGSGLSLTAETAPPAAAKLKVVGFQGVSDDISALSDGLGSTLLDFTTLGLAVGQWIKIGGTAAGDKFATAALNGFARISGTITATKIPLDNLPTGWTTDDGYEKTIKVWVGDQVKNGLTETSLSIERGFLGQSVPTYIVTKGMHVNTIDLNLASKQKITGTAAFMGMGGSSSTVALDASPDAATTNKVMAANANVGRLAENGSIVTAPNWARSLTLQVNNNLRQLEDVGSDSPPAVREGECTVTGKIDTYFGDDTMLNKFYDGTVTSINARVAKDGQAIILQVPRATLRGGGNPQVTGKNTDVMASFDYSASKDETTSAHIIVDRICYYES